MKRLDLNINNLIRCSKNNLNKKLILAGIFLVVIIYIFFKSKTIAIFLLYAFLLFQYYVIVSLVNYINIKKNCNYLIKENANYKILWSNLIDCILTDDLIVLYKNGQYNSFRYSDILSMELSREKKFYGRNMLRYYNIFLMIVLKDGGKFNFMMYSNDITIYKPLGNIKDICPIILEKNKDIKVIDNSQKGVFDFDFRE